MLGWLFTAERAVWQGRVDDLKEQARHSEMTIKDLTLLTKELTERLLLPAEEPMRQAEMLQPGFPPDIQAAIDARSGIGAEDAEVRRHLENFARTQMILGTETGDIGAAILAGTDLSEI